MRIKWKWIEFVPRYIETFRNISIFFSFIHVPYISGKKCLAVKNNNIKKQCFEFVTAAPKYMILHSSLAICILRMKKDVTSLQNSESCDNNSFKNKSNRWQLVYSIAFFILLVGHSFSFCTFTLFLCLYLLHFDVFYSLLWKNFLLCLFPTFSAFSVKF